jgi:hypothetical protein
MIRRPLNFLLYVYAMDTNTAQEVLKASFSLSGNTPPQDRQESRQVTM